MLTSSAQVLQVPSKCSKCSLRERVLETREVKLEHMIESESEGWSGPLYVGSRHKGRPQKPFKESTNKNNTHASALVLSASLRAPPPADPFSKYQTRFQSTSTGLSVPRRLVHRCEERPARRGRLRVSDEGCPTRLEVVAGQVGVVRLT